MGVAFFTDNNSYSVLNEIKILDGANDTYKIRGSSTLQTIDEVNANRRIYTKAICERFLDTANDKITRGTMLGEMDHPLVADLKDPKELKRQLSVLYKDASHKFSKMWIEGNSILSVVETLSNTNGVDLAKMANIDEIPIGFSCRAVGKVKPATKFGQGIVEVTTPVVFVTYDAVTDPSHKTAVLSDITDVIHSGKLKRMNEGFEESVAIDESSTVMELADIFIKDTSTLDIIVENFLFGKSNSKIKNKINTCKNTFDMLLQEYLDSSDKLTGVSSDTNLNESNVQSLMQDYANRHREYTKVEDFNDSVKKFLS